jgi:hypothetical protein
MTLAGKYETKCSRAQGLTATLVLLLEKKGSDGL